MEYTGNRAIDKIRKETEILAGKTLFERREGILLSLGIQESEVDTVLVDANQISKVLRGRPPVMNSLSEILELVCYVIAYQEKRIQELENKLRENDSQETT